MSKFPHIIMTFFTEDLQRLWEELLLCLQSLGLSFYFMTTNINVSEPSFLLGMPITIDTSVSTHFGPREKI